MLASKISSDTEQYLTLRHSRRALEIASPGQAKLALAYQETALLICEAAACLRMDARHLPTHPPDHLVSELQWWLAQPLPNPRHLQPVCQQHQESLISHAFRPIEMPTELSELILVKARA